MLKLLFEFGLSDSIFQLEAAKSYKDLGKLFVNLPIGLSQRASLSKLVEPKVSFNLLRRTPINSTVFL